MVKETIYPSQTSVAHVRKNWRGRLGATYLLPRLWGGLYCGLMAQTFTTHKLGVNESDAHGTDQLLVEKADRCCCEKRWVPFAVYCGTFVLPLLNQWQNHLCSKSQSPLPSFFFFTRVQQIFCDIRMLRV